jgi:hypothetical protein
MTCNIKIHSIANVLVTWGPLGELSGFAEGDDAISIEPSDNGQNSMKISADGKSGSISGNARTNGECMIKFEPGATDLIRIRNLWQSNRFALGPLTVVDVETGEAHVMECALVENNAPIKIGSEAANETEIKFLYKSLLTTPPITAISQLA